MSTLRVNVILFGIGNVGSTLIKQVIESQKFFLEKRNINLRFPIITNSTLAFFEKEVTARGVLTDILKIAEKIKIKEVICQ